MNIAIIGLGMIGGSIAKSLKRLPKKYTIYAYDTDVTTLQCAYNQHIVDVIMNDFSRLSEAEVVFVAVPCGLTSKIVTEVAKYTTAIISDVASVKLPIERQAKGLNYVGGHPMAGVENGGYSASKPHMFENAYYVLTANKQQENTQKVAEIVTDMGAKPYFLDAVKHDKTVAEISHLPHAVAFSLVNAALDSEDGKVLASGGFKDITRIAASSAELWEQIFRLNLNNLVPAIDKFITNLTVLKAMLMDGKTQQALAFMTNAKDKRENLSGIAYGALSKVFELSVDVEDKIGALSKITATLAKKKISIANINIENSREGHMGALKLKFFDRTARENAEKVLNAEGIKCSGI